MLFLQERDLNSVVVERVALNYIQILNCNKQAYNDEHWDLLRLLYVAKNPSRNSN